MALHECLFLRIEKDHGADELGEDAAPVNIADEEDRGPGVEGDPHIDDVGLLEIDLRGTPRPFHDDDVVVPTERVECGGHLVPDRRLHGVVLARGAHGARTTHDDDLRASLSLGLEKNRIHLDAWGDHGGSGLHRL